MACNSNMQDKQYYTLSKPLRAAIDDNKDSLDKTFYLESFLKSMDTLKLPGRQSPKQLAVLEGYSNSAYTVTTIKLLLLDYTDSTTFKIYRYSPQSKAWGVTREGKFKNKKFNNLNAEILGLPYWEQDINSTTIHDGDVWRFTTQANGIKVVKISESPELLGKIISITTDQ